MKFKNRILKIALAFTLCFSTISSTNVLAGSKSIEKTQSETKKSEKSGISDSIGNNIGVNLNLPKEKYVAEFLKYRYTDCMPEQKAKKFEDIFRILTDSTKNNSEFKHRFNFYCIMLKLLCKNDLENEFSLPLNEIFLPFAYYFKVMCAAFDVYLSGTEENWKKFEKEALDEWKNLKLNGLFCYAMFDKYKEVNKKMRGVIEKTNFRNIFLTGEEFKEFKDRFLKMLDFERKINKVMVNLLRKVIKYKAFDLYEKVQEISFKALSMVFSSSFQRNRKFKEKKEEAYLKELEGLDKFYTEEKLKENLKNKEIIKDNKLTPGQKQMLISCKVSLKTVEDLYDKVIDYLIDKTKSIKYEEVKDLNINLEVDKELIVVKNIEEKIAKEFQEANKKEDQKANVKVSEVKKEEDEKANVKVSEVKKEEDQKANVKVSEVKKEEDQKANVKVSEVKKSHKNIANNKVKKGNRKFQNVNKGKSIGSDEHSKKVNNIILKENKKIVKQIT